MKPVQLFEHEEFGKIRVVGEKDGEPWFVAKDIAVSLGFKNISDALKRHCRGVVKHDLPSSSGNQQYSIIPEADVYRLIMRSNLPSAERFQDWVCEEVLPSIRKHGSYSMKPTPGEKQLKAYALFEKAMSAAKKLGLPTHEAGWRAIHSVKEAEGIDLHDTLGFGPVGKLETFIDGRANPTMKALLTFYQDLKAGQVSFPKYPAFMDDERIYFSSTAIRQYLKVNHKMGTPHKINSELVSLGVVEEQDKERAYQGRRCAHLTIILRSQLDKLLP